MPHKTAFIFTFFIFLIQFNSTLFSIELFSLSYDDDGLKTSVLCNTVYDEAKIKEEAAKEALRLLFLQEESKKADLILAEEMQKLEAVKREIIATEESVKRKTRKLSKEILKT